MLIANTGRRIDPSPDVLVVIVNYNGGDLLLRAVKAMTLQTYRRYHLLVVDNASTDSSVLALRAAFPDVEIVQASSNLGFAAANNLAVRRISGTRWIALLNPDAFPEPDWLEKLTSAACENSGTASFASRTITADDMNRLDGAGDAYHVSGRYWRRGYGLGKEGRYLAQEEIFSACGAAALYVRSAWEELGGLDEDFFCYGEDVDLGFRLQLAGYKCLYVPEAVALHCGSAVTGERSDFSTYYGQRNLIWVYVKNMPAPLFWAMLPFHAVLNVAAILECTARGQGGAVLRAKLAALLGLPRMWGKRSAIQGDRRARVGRVWKILERGWPAPGGADNA